MAYVGYMELTDFQGNKIQLSPGAWEHIQEDHPEITMEELTKALESPDETRESKHNKPKSKCKAVVYYRLKTQGPDRFTVVVVKFCDDGNFINTAYTASKMKDGKTDFKRGEP